MHDAPHHRTARELEEGLADVLASPRDGGALQAIFVRPAENERRSLDAAALSPEGGIDGDRWAVDHWQKLPDGRPDPRSQLTLMNARMLRLLAGDENAMSLAGDNLIVDLDLGEENLPAGVRLRVGEDVLLQITDVAHTGCGKFSRRYGPPACQFVNDPRGKQHNLRGRHAQVLTGGTIQVGDRVVKDRDPTARTHV